MVSQCIRTHVTRIELCPTNWQDLEVEMKREKVLSLKDKMSERMSSWKTRVFIGNPCHVVGPKCAG